MNEENLKKSNIIKDPIYSIIPLNINLNDSYDKPKYKLLEWIDADLLDWKYLSINSLFLILIDFLFLYL